MKKFCKNCKTEYEPKRRDSKFCCNSCRVSNFQKNKKISLPTGKDVIRKRDITRATTVEELMRTMQ